MIGTDSTHVRANASRASEELVEVAEEAGVYWERLDDYEEEGLEELERRTGKRRKSGQSRSNGTTAAPTSASAAQIRRRVI